MSQPRPRFPIGHSDFRNVREGLFVYVDKSSLIDEIIDEPAQAMLVPRPRRFGKTLNLSMLRYFFGKSDEDLRPLFAGLEIESSKTAWAHFQRHPVIFMTFKDVKPRSWEDCFADMSGVLAGAFAEHRYLRAEGRLSVEEARVFTAILDNRATKSELTRSLKMLSELLTRYHGEKVVLLIDEYDSPIHAGYTNQYYDDVVAFFRDFLSGGLKDNEYLFKGVLTGILRVAKESLFSGLNNVEVYSILRKELSTAFGFTEAEVRFLAEAAGQIDMLDGIRSFYNGYLFGGHAISNPWSVLNFLNRQDKVFRPYWIETSSNDLVRELLLSSKDVEADFETLLAGGVLDKRVDENIVLRDLASMPDAIWSFLLFTGYLKAIETTFEEGRLRCKLAAPNTEVALALRNMASLWMETQAGGSNQLESMLKALLRGDAPEFERYLTQMMKVNLSFFDTASPEPERFYHGLVVGLLASLSGKYDVRSNRESGFGRCDVMILPKTAGQPGLVLELKSVDTEGGETIEKAFRSALKQIRVRDYAAELRERGASPILEMAAVFEGKRAYARVAKEKKKSPAKATNSSKVR